ncbi:aromatic ring-hydroxylating oxygenase subunit alpha [Sphingopyxis terrae]|uniref:aromatic ring-hydroxylating oxygenase subunit alpha n=1 Tax=Sphingopyxis terrae TaxID=33052 RepID=UPI002A13D39B|nr:aromatic ring-hydroxylating dioxygenase subunit alpha [Sphingopyxis terrae]MDX8356473.1 aromatic ring-hydroxylating dioxygenase subunit alpha [Sphingopyxis terrae]
MNVAMQNDALFTLKPREFYLSEEIFAQEYERIFSKDWIYVGHASQFPNKGSFLKFRYAGEEIICVRGDGDLFYANVNVCRHRGARLCSADSGTAPAGFVCPYHQWRFDWDGSLKNVPQMKDGEYFDYKDFGLRTVHADLWHGMLFINLAEGPVEPLAQRMKAYDGVGAKFDPARTKLAHEEIFHIAANWKVVVENGVECYHCRGTHRALSRVIDVASLQLQMGDWMGDDAVASELGDPQQLKSGLPTCSADGSLITDKLLGLCTSEDHGIAGGINMMPNPAYIAFYVDHYWAISVRPVSAEKTELVYSWFVRADAEEGQDYDLAKLVEVGHITQTEDVALCEMTQSGIRSRHYLPGPIAAKVEPGIRDFAESYAKLMC